MRLIPEYWKDHFVAAAAFLLVLAVLGSFGFGVWRLVTSDATAEAEHTNACCQCPE